MKIVLIILSLFLSTHAFTQRLYWEQEENYNISVSLNDTAHTLDAFEKIEYINNSPDTLKYIWFHLWPNAYKNDKTAFSDQLLKNGNTKFYFSNQNDRGYINRLDFRVDNITAVVEDHPEHIDIVRLILPTPLPPGNKTMITTPFHVKLPYNFSRGGHDGQGYQITQWYPKPAVYDRNGWHPMPYLDQGEFYSEFGNYEVTITVPDNYVVAATGDIQNGKNEIDWMLKTKPGSKKEFPLSAQFTKTLKFRQDNVHDFAWFADKRFVVDHDSISLQSGKTVDVYAFHLNDEKSAWKNGTQSAKRAIKHYSELVGEYPYNVVSVVEGPESFGGGMEYPTITVISPTDDVKELDKTIVHEVGHNWFYGILASNERKFPWMDEGVNSYYENKYSLLAYNETPSLERIAFESKAISKSDQPADLSSDAFSEINYGLSAYYKTSEWLRHLESKIGTETFNKAMQSYYNNWKFKHPQPADLKAEFEKAASRNLDPEFSYLHSKGILPNGERTGTKTNFVFNIKGWRNYQQNPSKELITYGPAIGINSYDNIMVGAFITNMKLPPSPLQYFLAPMYATGSKKLAAIGILGYTIYPDQHFQSLDLGVSGSLFTARKFTDGNGNKNFLRFSKLVPGIKLTLKKKDPLSYVTKYIQFKSFFIGEDGLQFYRDTSGPLPVETYKITRKSRTLQQLRFVVENNRALYPYSGELKAEVGKYFTRLGFTGNYFFNYVKDGGLNVRVFAGKFIYTSSKTSVKQFATDKYHLNLSGPNGYEDYTYSDYFVGRNNFEGWQSQQMMVRDGAFKVRTDLLAQKVGRTDDWLIAANFTSTIPASINPFMLLPVKLPFKVFADIGTYAEAWKQNAQTDRFVFDAGLYLPLFKETINIYFPLFYSNVYADYYKSTITKKRFLRKISFSIDISNFSFRKIDRNLSF